MFAITTRPVLDKIANIGLPFFTILATLLVALKLPQWGLAVNLFSQIFWIYSAYRAWKSANQIGIFVTAIIMTVILVGGVINYWLF